MPSKVLALHLDNSTVKACLCNQGGTTSLFSRLASHLFNQADELDITLIPAYIPISKQKPTITVKVDSGVQHSSSHRSGCLSSLGSA